MAEDTSKLARYDAPQPLRFLSSFRYPVFGFGVCRTVRWRVRFCRCAKRVAGVRTIFLVLRELPRLVPIDSVPAPNPARAPYCNRYCN